MPSCNGADGQVDDLHGLAFEVNAKIVHNGNDSVALS